MATLTVHLPHHPDHLLAAVRGLLRNTARKLWQPAADGLGRQHVLAQSYRSHPAAHHVPLRVWQRQGALLAAMRAQQRG